MENTATNIKAYSRQSIHVNEIGYLASDQIQSKLHSSLIEAVFYVLSFYRTKFRERIIRI